MFETLLKYFQDSPLSLWGPFGVLILCGLGLPLPEDVVLISAGALGQIDGRSWLSVSLLMYAGVMIGDSTIFLTGRYLGQRLLATRWFQRYLSPAKQQRVEVQFHRFGSMVLFVARFLPGLRAPVFFTAGSMKVRYWKFLLFDGLAALISVPFFVWLGHWLWAKFHDDLAQLDRVLARSQWYSLLVTGGIATLVILAIAVRLRRRHRAAR
ncbi:MAG TPA: DedA family protein [Acidobacteriota bacterium]|nr:DedA family protein [Acidobacteriota bacterium]